jgi:hypothetical protein
VRVRKYSIWLTKERERPPRTSQLESLRFGTCVNSLTRLSLDKIQYKVALKEEDFTV